VVGQEAAEQLYPLVLRERFRLAEPRRRQSKAPGDLAGDAPQQEGPDGVAAVFAVFDMPGVDVGLAAGGQGEAVLGEPLKEGRGGLDQVAGMAAAGRSDRLSLRAGAEPRQDFPSGEAADELGMVRVSDVSEMADQPPLERADLLVDGGEHTAGHQEFPQVAGRPPELEGVECLVGQAARRTWPGAASAPSRTRLGGPTGAKPTPEPVEVWVAVGSRVRDHRR